MFANPLGLLALLALPAIVGLHLFRRRFTPRPVSAVFLWAPMDRASHAGRKRAPLHRSPSFWLELLAALLLALLLAGPRGCGGGDVVHAVVILDGSASMSAGGHQEAATAAARRTLQRLPRRSRITLLQTAQRPQLLSGPGAPREEALIALDRYQPTALRHDLRPSIDLGWELSGGAVTFITDQHNPEAWPDSVELIALGTPAPNVAITNATRLRRVGGDQVFLHIRSFMDADAQVMLSMHAGDTLIQERPLRLSPQESASLSMDLPQGAGTVEARIEASGDRMAIDNRVALAPPPPRVLGLATSLPADTAQLAGLGEDGARWARLTADSVLAGPEQAHLLISDRADTGGDSTWTLVLSSTAPAQAFLGPFLIDRGHPLLDGITLQGAIWSGAPRALPGIPLISAGEQTLLSEEITDTGQRIFHANIDLQRSNLHRTPDWPILLANLAELRRRAMPGPQRTNLLLGDTFIYVDPPEGAWSLDGPGGRRALSIVDDLVVDGLDQPGVHSLQRDGAPVTDIAVRFLDSSESDLSALGSGSRAAELESATLEAETTPLDSLLLVMALMCLGLDWWVLWRESQRGG